MFTFIIQLLVLSRINSISAGETLLEFHVNGTILQQPRDYPCPDAADIAPCVCSYDLDSDRLTLLCLDISSNEELASILAKEFPVNDFYEFSIGSSSSLTALDFACGGVNFRRFNLHGPFPLVEVSDTFYQSCSNEDLEYVNFYDTQLTSMVFPPPPLSDNITDFIMTYSNVASVPPIRSDSLSFLELSISQISQITPGTFDEIPNLQNLTLDQNLIKILQTGSIPISSNGNYSFYGNGMETIEPGAFTLKGELTLNSVSIFLGNNLLTTIDALVFEFLMPYIDTLYIYANPLECGCDLAWIITNPEYMEKLEYPPRPPTCVDGTLLTDLDATQYEQSC